MKTKIFRIYVPESCWDHFYEFLKHYGYRYDELSEVNNRLLCSLDGKQKDLDQIIRDEK